MKKFILINCIIFLFFTGIVQAQRRSVESKSTAPVTTVSKNDVEVLFNKGKWEYHLNRQDLGYSHSSIKTNGMDQGHQSDFKLNLGTNYFVADNIGIGLELNTDFNSYKNTTKQTGDSWMTYANFTYGKACHHNFNFFARAGIGLGGNTSKYTPITGSSTTDKSNLFGYKVDVGFPIRIDKEEPIYFTPKIGYRYLQDKFDGGTETDDRFCFGFDFETYLFCKEMECDSHLHHALSTGMYDQGNSFFGVTTRGRFDFGNNTTKYDNNSFAPTKEKYSIQDLDANYMYYIVHDFALGVDLGFNNNVYKTAASNTKQTNNSFNFMPMFNFNIPSENQGLNNLFIMGGYGFGSAKNEYTSGTTSNTTKYSTTDFCAGLGYNLFFHKRLAFDIGAEYDISTSKNKTTDVKTKYSGLELSCGIKTFLRN